MKSPYWQAITPNTSKIFQCVPLTSLGALPPPCYCRTIIITFIIHHITTLQKPPSVAKGFATSGCFLSLCSLINKYMYKLFVILCFKTNLKTRFSKITYKNNSPRFFLPFFLISFITLEWGKKKQRPPHQTAERVGRGGR